MAECIPIETLLRWLADDISPAEADGVGAHVAVCVRCQALLDQETEHTGLRDIRNAKQRHQEVDCGEAVLDDLVLRIQSTLAIGREPPDRPG